MVLNNDEFFMNRTFRYLFPILRKYGSEYCRNMALLDKQGVFSYDWNNMTDEKCLFVVINLNKCDRMSVNDIISFFRSQEYVKSIHILDVKNMSKRPNRMIMSVMMPEEYSDSIDRMMKGRYSEMFSENDIFRYFVPVSGNNLEKFYSHSRMVLNGKTKELVPKLGDEAINY